MTNALRDAEHTAAVVSAMGPTVFPTNGPARIAEGMLQVAIAEAQTKRANAILQILRVGNLVSVEARAELVVELRRLVTIMTTTEGSDDAETA